MILHSTMLYQCYGHMTAYDTRYRTEKDRHWMRTSLGNSRILWQYRDAFQLLTASDRYLEHLKPLFMNERSLSDDFLLRQRRKASSWYNQYQSVDIDGISCELFDARRNQFLLEHWETRFASTDPLIFVVPLSAYCRDELPSAPVGWEMVSEMYAF